MGCNGRRENIPKRGIASEASQTNVSRTLPHLIWLRRS